MTKQRGLMAAMILMLGSVVLAEDVTWKRLAEVELGDSKSEVTVASSDQQTKFRQVKVKVEGADVKLEKVALKYGDNTKAPLPVPGKMNSGQESDSLPLKDGEKRHILEIIVKGECQVSGEKAKLVVYGLMKDDNK